MPMYGEAPSTEISVGCCLGAVLMKAECFVTTTGLLTAYLKLVTSARLVFQALKSPRRSGIGSRVPETALVRVQG